MRLLAYTVILLPFIGLGWIAVAKIVWALQNLVP